MAALAVEALVVVLLYAAIAFLLLQPMLSDPAGSVLDARTVVPRAQGYPALKDVLLLVWVYAWGWHAVSSGPLALYDGNAFYPYPSSLAFSESSIGKLFTAGAVFGLTDNAVLAHQVDLILSFALSGAALYALLRDGRVGIGAALLAGAVFAFCPARLEMVFHSHLLGWQYLPLALLFLQRTLLGGRVAAAIGFGGLLLVQCLCSYYLAYMSLVAVVAYGAAFALIAREGVSRRGAALAAGAAIAALAVFATLSWPYLEMRASGVVPRYPVDAPGSQIVLRFGSAHPWRSFLLPGPAVGEAVAGRAFVGWLPLVAALLGCWSLRGADRRRRAMILACLAVTLVAWLLSLGPAVDVGGRSVPLPYAALSYVVPGFSSMRAPGRFSLLVMLGFAGLVGFGLDAVSRARSRSGLSRPLRWGLGAAFALALVVEYRLPERSFPAYRVLPDGEAPAVYAELARLARGPVAEFPFHGVNGIDAARAMVYSTAHWHPIVNGKSGYEPRGRRILRRVAGGLPKTPAFLPLLVRMTGVKYIVVHPSEVGREEAAAWRQLPGVRWIRTTRDGDLLGIVTVDSGDDLRPLLLACAGYPSAPAAVRAADPCARLEAYVEQAMRSGRRPRGARSAPRTVPR